MKYTTWVASLTLLSLLGFAPKLALADEAPTTGAARVSIIHGDVSTQRGDSGDWVSSTVNAPLVRGDRLSTGANSRTEVQLDYANVMRLDQRSEAKIADLTRTRIQLQIAQGTMTYTVFKGSEAEVEIDTPNMAVRPLGEGTYRIQVNSPSETEVTVRQNGQAEITTPQGSTLVKNNERVTVQGTDNPQYKTESAPGGDEWDNWNRERDAAIRNANSYQHVNNYYTGAQDLDHYGHWVYVPNYDWCWTPYVDAGWVPYRSGRWVWEPYWGWTWVSYEPWGWAPYHYGRWVSYGGEWCWWPGLEGAGFFPTWGPAWVSFIGFGFGHRHFGFGFGFGFNSIGWCPLAPFDPFFPWWGFGNSFNVVNVTNITNIRNVTNITNIRNGTGVVNGGNGAVPTSLANALNDPRARRAVTTVSMKDFVNGRTPRQIPAVQAATLRNAQLVNGTLPVVPTRQSLLPVNKPVNQASLPTRAASNQNFFTRREPPAGPQAFSGQAAQIQRMVETHNPLAAAPAGSNLGGRAAAQGTASGAVNAGAGFRSGISAQGSGQAPSAANVPQVSAQQAGTPHNDLRLWHPFGPARSPGSATASGAQGSGAAAAPAPQPQTRAGENARSTGASPGWQRFGTSGSRPASSPSETRSLDRATPRSSQPQSAPPAPQSPNTRGWNQFTPQPAPTRPETRFTQPASPGGSEFPSRPQEAPQARRGPSQGWSGGPSNYRSAPTPEARPPLELRKPIVAERAPSASPGGYRGGGWGGGSRGGGGGGQSRGTGNSGGGGAPSHSSQGHGHK